MLRREGRSDRQVALREPDGDGRQARCPAGPRSAHRGTRRHPRCRRLPHHRDRAGREAPRALRGLPQHPPRLPTGPRRLHPTRRSAICRSAEVGPAILDEFYDRLSSERQLAPATIRRVHAVLRGAFARAVKWKWITTNPARDASPPTVRRKDINLPTSAQIAAAVAEADRRDPTFGVFVRLAAATGARRGELCALRWRADQLADGLGVHRARRDHHSRRRRAHQGHEEPLAASGADRPGNDRRHSRLHHRQMAERARRCGHEAHRRRVRLLARA